MEETIGIVRRHEGLTVGPQWTLEDSLALGDMAVAHARREGYPLSIIVRHIKRTVFQTGLPGSETIHDDWAMRKIRVVETFGKSSLLVRMEHEEGGTTFFEKHALSEVEFKAAGGAIPLRRSGEVIGVLAVSGLLEWTDHMFCVDTLAMALDARPSSTAPGFTRN